MVRQRSYVCTKCGNKYSSPHLLRIHFCRRKGTLKCKYCSKVFNYEKWLEKHQTKCKKLKVPTQNDDVGESGRHFKHMCYKCDKDFPTNALLTSHSVKMHLKLDNSVSCCLCDRRFVSYSGLRRHCVNCATRPKLPECEKDEIPEAETRQRKIPVYKRFPCFWCGVCFGSLIRLQAHQVSWTGSTPDEIRMHCEFTINTVDPFSMSDNTMSTLLVEAANAVAKFGDVVRDIPINKCESCDCLYHMSQGSLNRENARRGMRLADLRQNMGLPRHCFICRYCWNFVRRGAMSPTDRRNNMQAFPMPIELAELDNFERKFISPYNAFSTIVTLGGNENFAVQGISRTYPSNLQQAVEEQGINFEGKSKLCVKLSTSVRTWIRPPYIKAALETLRVCCPRFFANVDPDKELAAQPHDLPEARIDAFQELATTPRDPTFFEPPFDPSIDPDNLRQVLCLPKLPKSVSMFGKPFMEVMAFPHLFPFGINCYDYERTIKVSREKYIKSRILNWIDTFRTDKDYMSFLLTDKDVNQIRGYKSVILIQERKQCGAKVSVSDLRKTGHAKPATMDDITGLRNKELANKIRWLNFSTCIPGTAAYWRERMFDLNARVATVGPPRFFVTFSMNNHGWADIKELTLLTDSGKENDLWTAMKNDPVPSTRHCYHRFLGMVKFLREYKPFGELRHWFFRVEMQMRGVIHFHGLLWIVKDYLFEDKTTEGRRKLLEYLDKIIVARRDPSFPHRLNLLIERMHRHQCRPTCYVKDGVTKRCGFPKRVVPRTCFTDAFLNGEQCGHFVDFQHGMNDLFYNTFNPACSMYWGGNCDAQVLDGPDAVQRYITKYITKAEDYNFTDIVEDTRLLKMGEGGPLTTADCLLLYELMQSRRDVSTSEMLLRLNGMPLVITNLSVLDVNVRFPQNCFRRIRPEISEFVDQDIDENDDDREKDGDDDNSTKKLDETDVYFDNLGARYKKRPTALEEMTLYEFAKWWNFKLVSQAQARNADARVLSTDGTFIVTKRKQPRAVRMRTGYTESEEYYFGLLHLFVAHRDSDEFAKAAAGSYRNLFKFKYDSNLINRERVESLSHYKYMNNAINRIMLGRELLTRLNDLDKVSEAQFVDMLETGPEPLHKIGVWEEVQNAKTCPEPGDAPYVYETSNCDPDVIEMLSSNPSFEELLKTIQCFKQSTNDQALALKYVAHCLKTRTQIKLCILGGPGTGKSQILRLIMSYYRMIKGGLMEQDPICAMAYTGTAAINIGGRTLHSSLAIFPDSVPYESEAAYHMPSSLAVIALKRAFKTKKAIFIDEISMVSADLFNACCQRCNIAKGLPPIGDFMGGMDFVCAGDFLQLKPLFGSFLYTLPLFGCVKSLELREAPRYKDDPVWGQLLRRFQDKMLTTEDYLLLQSRVIRDREEFLKLEVDQFLFRTNKLVDQHNAMKIKECPGPAVKVYAIDEDSATDNKVSVPVQHKSFKVSWKRTGKLREELILKLGCRVSVTRNLGAFITNGTIGYVRAFHYYPDRTFRNYPLLESIDVEPIDPGISKLDPSKHNSHCINIIRCKSTFVAEQRIRHRRQFPLVLSYASTVHRAQGCTLDSVCVDLSCDLTHAGKRPLDFSLPFVAISRVRRAQDLYLWDSISLKNLTLDQKSFDWLSENRPAMDLFKQQISQNIKVEVTEELKIRYMDEE